MLRHVKSLFSLFPRLQPALLCTLVLLGGARVHAQDSPALELNKPIEKTLAGGQSHSYRITLEAGQFVRVSVEQRGIDVVVTLFAPDAKKLREVDAPTGEQGAETLSAVAEAGGAFRLEIKPGDEKAKAGQYQVRLDAVRPATEADRKLATAQRLADEGEQLRTQREEAARRQAITKFGEAIKLYRELGNQAEAGVLLLLTGNLYSGFNQPAQALESFNQALPLLRAAQDKSGEATALQNQGAIYLSTGQLRQALAAFEQALPLRRATKNRAGEATTLNSLGETYRLLGEKRKALRYFQDALPLRRAARDANGEGVTLNSLGAVYYDLGEMQKALDAYNQALPLRRTPPTRAITLANLGRAYDVLGAQQEALRNYEQALQIARSAGAKTTEADTLNFMGLAYWASGDYARAVSTLEQALPLAQAAKAPATEAAVYNNLCLVYTTQRDWTKALDAAGKALPLTRQIGNRQYEAYVLNNTGFAQEGLGNAEAALTAHRQALELAREVRDVQREAKIRYGIARIESSRNRLKPAREQLEQTIKIVESLRSKLTSPDLRAEYRASVQRYYDLYIDVLMRMGKRAPKSGLIAEALQVSERARARSLIELLSESGADIRQGVDAALVERERELQDQINDKATEQISLLRDRKKADQVAETGKQIDQLNAELREVQNRIRAGSPRYAALTQPQPPAARDLQRLLDANTMLLEFSLGEERSYLWTVTPAGIRGYTLPKRAVIEVAAKRFYDLLTARNQFVANESSQQKQDRIAAADAESLTAAAALSRMLIAPIAPLLGNKRLIVVADGALQYVPFGALSVGAPLIATHEVISLPSASTIAALRGEAGSRPKASRTVAVIADPVFETKDERVKIVSIKADSGETKKDDKPAPPPAADPSRILLYKSAKDSGATDAEFRIPRLPNTRREAETILALAGEAGKSSFDFAASRAAATGEDLSQYRILHFATHGFLNSLNPELSGLVLSLVDEQGKPQNGYLLAPELYNLKLPATELVVLSACQTGLGREVRGEGVVGLTRGFMYAGAPRVVVSLWSV
ncbi:MAG TPA: CHAT domain-containing protein, partial [Blastocatellia bacterium]|nr:CHAT domain-containing protein [Blastocatellia bacterium]